MVHFFGVGMIQIFRWDSQSESAKHIPAAELPPSHLEIPSSAFVWIDLKTPSREEERLIFEQFLPVHPLTLEDVTRPHRLPDQGAHLPKVEEFPGYLFVIVNPLPWEVCDPNHHSQVVIDLDRDAKHKRLRTRWKRPQLSAILTENLLITHHYSSLPCVNLVQSYVDRRRDIPQRGPDFLFHLILDEMVDEYAPVVERFAEQLDRVETRMFTRTSSQMMTLLLRLKRRVAFLRKTLILEREVLARLVRGEFSLVRGDEIVYYRNVYDHLVRYTELIENAREMVSDLMQTQLSAVSNRLNEVMKVLTVISLIGSICTLIAGVYGMNFEHMPELKWVFGYPMALAMMVVATVTCLAIFRYKRWV